MRENFKTLPLLHFHSFFKSNLLSAFAVAVAYRNFEISILNLKKRLKFKIAPMGNTSI